MKALFDSNILIDFLEGKKAAETELNLYDETFISRITWMEILIGAHTDKEAELRKSFLGNFAIVELNEAIAQEAITLRKSLRLKLPDAIILGSARVLEVTLVTRNHRDFSPHEPGVRIPY